MIPLPTDTIMTRARIEKAMRLNPKGVKRLAAFVVAISPSSWDIFCACERERAKELELRRQRIVLIKHGRRKDQEL